jgi:hypothetical protein
MKLARLASFATAAFLAWAAAATAQTPVALVEDLKGQPDGIDFMDYVAPGKVIQLKPAESLVLAYLKSCWREMIQGATVKVGAEMSDVQGGSVQREKISCEAGKMQLTVQLASKSGALVFRDPPRANRQGQAQLRPQFTLFGASPLVDMKSGAAVTIERMDQPGDKLELTQANRRLGRGAYYDFAEANTALAPSGIYRATSGKVQVLFQVDAAARPGATPVAGRLLQLQPE